MEIDFLFSGLPYAHIVLVHALLNRTDINTGIVKNISYQKLVSFLKVDPMSGRRKTDPISRQTIRSYLRTIEKFCPEHFKTINDGQHLIIKFPTLPVIFSSYLTNTEHHINENKGKISLNMLENVEQSSITEIDQNIDVYSDPYTEEYTFERKTDPVKNNNYINKNKTNNNKQASSKSFISDSFFPSAETLLRAKERGFENADDLREIQAFIDHNKAIGSQWANFDPIYLRWLENGKGRKTRQAEVKKSWSSNDGTSNKSYRKSAKQRVIDAYSDQFDYCEQTGKFYAKGAVIIQDEPQPETKPKYIDFDSLGPID